MFRWLRSLIRREVIDDVPPELDLCLDCGEVACSEARFQACAKRRARASELTAALAKSNRAAAAAEGSTLVG
jgi:hypothetical protein